MEPDTFSLAQRSAVSEGEPTNGGEKQTAHYIAIDYAVSELGDALKGLSVARWEDTIRKFLGDRNRLVPSTKTLGRYRKDKIGQNRP